MQLSTSGSSRSWRRAVSAVTDKVSAIKTKAVRAAEEKLRVSSSLLEPIAGGKDDGKIWHKDAKNESLAGLLAASKTSVGMGFLCEVLERRAHHGAAGASLGSDTVSTSEIVS